LDYEACGSPCYGNELGNMGGRSGGKKVEGGTAKESDLGRIRKYKVHTPEGNFCGSDPGCEQCSDSRENGTNDTGNEMVYGVEECESRFKCHGTRPS